MVTIENAKNFLAYRKYMIKFLEMKKAGADVSNNRIIRIPRKIVPLARKITGLQSNNKQAMIKAFRASTLRLAQQYKVAPNNKLAKLLNYKQNEILSRNTISRTLFKSKFLNDIRKRIEDKRLLAYSKQLLMYKNYLDHAHSEHQNTQERFLKYTEVYQKAGKIAKKITHSNDMNQAINVAKYVGDSGSANAR